MNGRFIFEYQKQQDENVVRALKKLPLVAKPLWSPHWQESGRLNGKKSLDEVVFGISWLTHRPSSKEYAYEITPLRTDLYTAIKKYSLSSTARETLDNGAITPANGHHPLTVTIKQGKKTYHFHLNLNPYT